MVMGTHCSWQSCITTSSAGTEGPWVFSFLASLAEAGTAVLQCHTGGSVAGLSTPLHPTPPTSAPQRQGWGEGTDGCRGDAGGPLDPRLNLLEDVEMSGGLPFRLTSPHLTSASDFLYSPRACELHCLSLQPLHSNIYPLLSFVTCHCHNPFVLIPPWPPQCRATIIPSHPPPPLPPQRTGPPCQGFRGHQNKKWTKSIGTEGDGMNLNHLSLRFMFIE